jgi:hypothetical protein
MTYSATYYFLPRCHFPGIGEDTDGLVPLLCPHLRTPIHIPFHLEEPDKSSPRDTLMISVVFLMRFGMKQLNVLMAHFIFDWVC